MKKNHLTTLLVSLFFSSLNAQGPIFEVKDLDHGNTIVSNNSTIDLTTNPFKTTALHFQIKNLSLVTQSIQVTKEDIEVNITNVPDTAKSYFCTGENCYEYSVKNVSIALDAGDSIGFIGDLDEASSIGRSEVRYKFITSGQTFAFVLKYNRTVSVIENSAALSNVSNVFPNPTTGNSFINVTAIHDQSLINIKVVNSLGSVISSQNQFLSTGENTLNINTEALGSGIYFVSLKQGNTVITKKITVVN